MASARARRRPRAFELVAGAGAPGAGAVYCTEVDGRGTVGPGADRGATEPGEERRATYPEKHDRRQHDTGRIDDNKTRREIKCS